MGGGHVSRPDFGRPKVNENDPMTDFYRALQAALDREPVFALPGAWAAFAMPPEGRVYADTIRACCRFYAEAQAGCPQVFAPASLQVLDMELCAAPDGTPTALLLTEESSRRTTAVQLVPPFAGPDTPLPPVPACTAAMQLTLSPSDIPAIDTAPAALGRRMAQTLQGKAWLTHPKLDRWMAVALAAAQRACGQQ